MASNRLNGFASEVEISERTLVHYILNHLGRLRTALRMLTRFYTDALVLILHLSTY